MPADRHRGHLRQIADDRLGRVDELDRELPVGDDDDSDHEPPAVNHEVTKYTKNTLDKSLCVLRSSWFAGARITDYACPISRCRTRTRAPARSARARRSRSAIITERRRPPVQPMAIVR